MKKRNPIHRALAQDYSKIFRDPQDIGDTRKMATPNPQTILVNLENFLKKWCDRQYNGQKVLNNKHVDAINTMRTHVQKGCLSEIPVHCSTSINERLHKDMKKVLCKNRVGVQLAYVKFSRYFFQHNQKPRTKDTINSLHAQQNKDFCFGGADLPNQCDKTSLSFGVRSKNPCNHEKQSLVHREQSTIRLPLTSAALDDISKSINEIFETEIKENILSTLLMPGTLEYDELQSNYNEQEKCIAILQHSLSLYKVLEQVKTMWSAKPINVLKIPFLYQQNIITHQSASNLQTFTGRVDECPSMQSIATAFGLQIVPVSADGNCFFRSVAFQILQVMHFDCSAELSRHLQNLGISAEATTEDLQLLLRALLVEEWINNRDEYQSFIDPLEFESEVRRFRRNGELAGPLGDALPLGMANVLNIPLVIFTTVHNMPIIPVAPRRTVSNCINIYLAYSQQGSGHYDALVGSPQDQNAGFEEDIDVQEIVILTGKNSYLSSIHCHKFSRCITVIFSNGKCLHFVGLI